MQEGEDLADDEEKKSGTSLTPSCAHTNLGSIASDSLIKKVSSLFIDLHFWTSVLDPLRFRPRPPLGPLEPPWPRARGWRCGSLAPRRGATSVAVRVAVADVVVELRRHDSPLPEVFLQVPHWKEQHKSDVVKELFKVCALKKGSPYLFHTHSNKLF